jgi:hypothetical protein
MEIRFSEKCEVMRVKTYGSLNWPEDNRAPVEFLQLDKIQDRRLQRPHAEAS